MQGNKLAVTVKEPSSVMESNKQTSEKPLPPSIMASTVSLQSARPPPYSEAAYDNDGYVDDPVPGPSNLENQTLDVPAVPQRKVCRGAFRCFFCSTCYLNCLCVYGMYESATQ